MMIRNLLLALKDQGPPKRFLRNFFITRNAWGLFHVNSHIAQRSQKPKVAYPTKESAVRAATAMAKKNGFHYSPYKCVWCDGFHIGRNRTSIESQVEAQ